MYATDYPAMTAAKFGFVHAGEAAQTLAREAFALLFDGEVDFTRFFRALGEIPDEPPSGALLPLLGDVFYDDAKRAATAEAMEQWLQRWHAAVRAEGRPFAARRAAMHAVNPRYVLRNYLAQQAIDAATTGDPSLVHTLLEVMRRPYDDQPGRDAFAQRRPEWARVKAGCSMLSCSS